MNAKQRRLKREKQIAINAWYSCMIAMGSVPADENLYFETKYRFNKKYRIREGEKIKITCDSEFEDIKNRYFSLKYEL